MELQQVIFPSPLAYGVRRAPRGSRGIEFAGHVLISLYDCVTGKRGMSALPHAPRPRLRRPTRASNLGRYFTFTLALHRRLLMLSMSSVTSNGSFHSYGQPDSKSRAV